ncbi:AMIN-like domain-containing (lipo)protein [Saccharopolyspora flava]|uniref:AMIN-like domain-containing protein n=1 Tax=Saccharopolyspora flava TaxID=95161 RepID=A0A1I6TES7_9PSEU|nr:hypothetical protein [Saccharopolyspora flava]SFS87722.1 hypothetical protein SAMN05660874_03950 [Saccharopolyspora flava]
MSFRTKLAVATGSVVLSALALTGCSAGAQQPVVAPVLGQASANQPSSGPAVGHSEGGTISHAAGTGDNSESADTGTSSTSAGTGTSSEAAGTYPGSGAYESGDAVDTPVGDIDIRAGQHGSEERVVFDFSSLSGLSGGISVNSHELNQTAPVWGGSAEPVQGMKGTNFLHIYLNAADAGRTTAGPELFNLPTAKSAVVNDNSHGTAEMTIGLDSSVDYEVLVEGEKLIINMTRGPLGR